MQNLIYQLRHVNNQKHSIMIPIVIQINDFEVTFFMNLLILRILFGIMHFSNSMNQNCI